MLNIIPGFIGILLIIFIAYQPAIDIFILQDKSSSLELHRTTELAVQETPKQILLYNPTIWLESKNIYKYKFFQRCPVNNCKIVYNRHEAHSSDAVIFHLWITRQVPKFKRPNGQVWIMNQHEAPPEYEKLTLPKFKNHFNWTVSYSNKADIVLPYGQLLPKPRETIIQRNYLHIAEKKTKDALWIVSRCKTHSKRGGYVNILKKYIGVDILGACGKKWKCGKRWHHDDCFGILNTTYRYYLAFENALCDDYITEKFFENLQYDIIPIVRASNPKFRPLNISRDAYVSASDFKNAHELGKYLKALSRNTSKYAAMLETKDTYQVVPYMELFEQATCEICQRLHNINEYRSVYEDTYRWIMTQQQCFQPKDL